MRYLKHINPKSDTIKHKDYFYERYVKNKIKWEEERFRSTTN